MIEETVRLREKELNNKKVKVSMEAGVSEPMIRGDVEQGEASVFQCDWKCD